MTDGPQPPSKPTAHPTHKYDRQIRIWGDHGQAALQRASVCLVNASAAGTETLKNLVLPGIGSFTVVDGEHVTDPDRGNNFFLTAPEHVKPRNRALVTVEAMHELNPAVHGAYIPHHVHSFVPDPASAYQFFSRFSVVIVASIGLGHPVLRHIAAGCYEANVPLLVVRAYGMIGAITIHAPELCVLDSKQDDAAPDLRLHAPFPELLEFTHSVQIDQITDTTALSHIPFLVILVKAVSLYRASNDGKLPSTRQEKEQLASLVASLRPNACSEIADNFEEALKRANLRLCYADAAEIPHHVRKVLTDDRSDPSSPVGFKPLDKKDDREKCSFPEAISVSRRPNRAGLSPDNSENVPGVTTPEERQGADRIRDENTNFWVHAAGVRLFVEQTGALPLRGSLPDMTADTQSYVSLQKLYSAKAAADAKQVLALAQKVAERHGVEVELDESSVRNFCRNVHGVRVYGTRSIADELQSPSDGGFLEAATMEGALDASGSGLAAPYYVLLRAVDEFYREHGRHAGCDPSVKENDVGLVHEYASKVKEEVGVGGGGGLWRDYAEEIVRFGNVELHNVAAFMAGIAAQEVTKILTRQFVPVNNTLVFNLAQQTSVTFPA